MDLLSKVLQLKNELDSLRPLKKEDELRIMQKFRLDWNYHSNHLEGNSLTYGETKALILHGITARGKPLKDHFEVTGHNEAVEWVLQIVKQDRPLSEYFIRELHALILKEPYQVKAITADGQPTSKRVAVGSYKTMPNHVQTVTGEIFRFAEPEEVPFKMQELVDWYRNEIDKDDVNPILVASHFHYKFIRIHPFDDGNGRTARIVMNFILMQFGYPPVVIKTQDKANYFSALQQADAGMIDAFVEYITENLLYSLELMIKGAKGESIEDPDDVDKKLSLLEQQLNALSKPLDVVKSKEIVLEVYDNSIEPLLKKFIQQNEKFEKFYVKNSFYLQANGSGISKKDTSKIRSIITCTKEMKSIKAHFNYNVFNCNNSVDYDYKFILQIEFKKLKYEVLCNDNLIIAKPYNEILTEEEIDNIVNHSVSKHTDHIEKIIAEIQSKKHNE